MTVTALGIFDYARPDVHGVYHNHARLNQHVLRWREDFMLARTAGIRTIRCGIPWTLIEPDQGLYLWAPLDEQIAAAQQLGLTPIPALTHFSWPFWLRNAEHPALDPNLPAAFAAYAERFCARYAAQVQEVVPIIEIGTDAWSRAIAGHWGPHMKGDTALAMRIEENLIAAFNAVAAACREHGITVISHESANCLDIALRLDADEVGIDHYTHAGFPDFADVLREWHDGFAQRGRHPPFSLLERGAPESFNRSRNAHTRTAEGSVRNRLDDIAYYVREIARAREDGIDIRYFGTFVVGNLWSSPFLEQCDSCCECDRNALVDLKRDAGKNLTRERRHELIQAFHDAVESMNTPALRAA